MPENENVTNPAPESGPALGGELNNGMETTAQEQEKVTESTSENKTPAETAESAESKPAPALGEIKQPEQKPAEESKPAEETEYKFTLPEGYEATPEIMQELTPILKGMKATQEQAQSLANLHCKLMSEAAAAHQQAINNLVQEWQNNLKNDPEIGGTKLAENLSYGNRLLKEFGSPELFELMSNGLNVNPAMVKFMVKVGKAFAEDHFVDSSKRGASQRTIDTVAQNLFSKSLGGK